MTWPEPVWATTSGWSLLSTTTVHLLGAAILLTICLLCLLPSGRPVGRWQYLVAMVSGVAGLVWLWTVIPDVGSGSATASFWAISALTLGSALATISARSPVYSAIWFALSLLGTACLFLLQGAQFVSIATIAVYAGAIVVTFLFVLMLAQPQGYAFYDRVSRGFPTRLVSTLTAVSFAVIVAASLPQEVGLRQRIQADLHALHGNQVTLRSIRIWQRPSGDVSVGLSISTPDELRQKVTQEMKPLTEAIAAHFAPSQVTMLTLEEVDAADRNGVLTSHHMASLGSQLFTRHLIAVEVAGTLLLVALVGAIAMVSRDATGEDLGTRESV